MADPILNILSRGANGDSSSFCIKAQPHARREGIVGLWNGGVRVAVREPAEGGRANDAILSVLAEVLGVRKVNLQITAGAASPRKTVLASGLAPTIARERLLAALPAEERS